MLCFCELMRNLHDRKRKRVFSYLQPALIKFKWEKNNISEFNLTVSTYWPVRLTELIVRQTSEGVVVLVEVCDEPIVRCSSIALVHHSLIMRWWIVGVPEQQQLALSWRIRRTYTMGPYMQLINWLKLILIYIKLHSQLSGNAESDQVLFAWHVTLVYWKNVVAFLKLCPKVLHS